MEAAARPLGVERAPTLVSMLDWILPVGVGSNSHVNSSLLTFAELRRANTRSLGSIGETADVVFSFGLPLRDETRNSAGAPGEHTDLMRVVVSAGGPSTRWGPA